MERLIEIKSVQDIPKNLRNTPIGLLLEYHNLARPEENYDQAEILIGMCMDHRKHLHIPENFAYILRTGGGNLRYSEFKVSYAVAIGEIKAIALMAHNRCGMVNLHAKKERFIQGLVKAGWEEAWAEEHFNNFAPLFEIGNEVDFVLSEAQRLRNRYPKLLVVPLFYDLETNLLSLIAEE